MKKIVKIAAVIFMAVCSIRFVQCYGLSSKSAVDLDEYSTAVDLQQVYDLETTETVYGNTVRYKR